MVTEDYKVRLERFEGPLDLLLHLIRRAEVDVTTISLASIAEQYLKYLDRLSEVDVENAGEFLVTAATLVELKARMVSPAPEIEGGEGAAATGLITQSDDDEEGDPAAELVRQLLAYKRIRDAAHALESRRERWENCFTTSPVPLDPNAATEPEDTAIDVDDLELYDLVEAYRRIIETVQFDRIGEHRVVYDDTPIELHAADLMDRVSREVDGRSEAGIALRRMFEGRTRGEVIGLFVAMLELVRSKRMQVFQDASGGEIRVRIAENDAEAGLAAESQRSQS
ncbi:MAG TPA: segregation/condensation protein A [Phycisphaerales bacterium]|nr:segregation/condensation protein A [Phycisphaerales bacterium]